jgi:hypothetical protein
MAVKPYARVDLRKDVDRGFAFGRGSRKLAGGHHCPFILMVTSEMNL